MMIGYTQLHSQDPHVQQVKASQELGCPAIRVRHRFPLREDGTDLGPGQQLP